MPRSSRRCRSPRTASGARGTTRLEAPPDTGVTLGGRRSRTPRHRNRKRAQLQLAGLAALVVLSLIVGWQLTRPADEPHTAAADTGAAAPEQVEVRADDRTEPTPFFAYYRSLHLYVPISPDDLTEIAFHQASGDKALDIESLLPDADMTLAEQNHGTDRTTQASSANDTTGTGTQVLGGTVLRMWRSNRSGPPDTAVDVGAAPGTTVYAPVTGEVVEVRPYMLYEKYEDYEIHIRPEGWPEIDIVMIHVEDPRVEAGDRVVGGVTALAGVRLLSDRITHQMSAYTTDGGNHVHVQLNQIDPAETGALDSLDGS